MPYRSTKTFGHDLGLSACFRQWRATHSHCRHLHGYALAVTLVFEADSLDDRRWVVDFGGLKAVKAWLSATFDHKTLVAHDDPELETFRALHAAGLVDLVVVPHVGCEAFAERVAGFVTTWLEGVCEDRVRLVSVEVREHGANSAVYVPGGAG
jgi:6-pyruvoyltetrahydropterin/6-carboxytetrahydropterin synthase